jgi:hypothetical protein
MSRPTNENQSGFWKIILLLIIAGAVVLSISPVSAEKPSVTIIAKGCQSYYWGEQVVFSGYNDDSDSTYLFVTGPNLPEAGGKLTSTLESPTSGDPGSFAMVKTKPDHSWEYTLYTSGVKMDAGVYTIYAVSQPETKDRFTEATTYGSVSIIVKKPFVMAEITPVPVLKGQPFTITGTADGDPGTVEIWIIGDNFLYNTIVSVDQDSEYMYYADTRLSEQLPAGQCYLIVQHPMQDNQIDILTSGDQVKMINYNGGSLTDARDLFRFRGPGGLQGRNVVQALIAAIDDPNVDDTYIEIPFTVEEAGTSAPQAQVATAAPVRQQTRSAPLQYAPVGAIVLSGMIALRNRHS